MGRIEIWKDIYFWENGIEYDYRGEYQVSNCGRVKSLKRGKERELKTRKHKNDYLCTMLYKNGKKYFLIHRLVAFVFLSESYFEGAEIDHIDTDRTNNHVNNLRWCTSKENSNNDLTKKHYSKAQKGKTLSEETKQKMSEANKGSLIARYSLDGELIDIKYNFEFVEMGFDRGNISHCCKGRYKQHKGFIFKYYERDEENA